MANYSPLVCTSVLHNDIVNIIMIGERKGRDKAPLSFIIGLF